MGPFISSLRLRDVGFRTLVLEFDTTLPDTARAH
jgi:hypothetical protein